MQRLIDAVTALRSWRDTVSVPAGPPCRLGWRPRATTGPPSRSPGSRASPSRPTRASRWPRRGPRRERPGARRWRVRRRAGRATAGRAPGRAGGRGRRAEGKLANERFVERAPAHVVEGERAKLERLRGELEACDARALVAGAGRGLPALPRAVRDALRARPHAPVDDGDGVARSARFASIHVVGTNGKSSTVAHDRGDPRAPRRAHRRVPVAAPGELRRARPGRRARPRRGRVRARRSSAPPTPPRWWTARWPRATASRSSRR